MNNLILRTLAGMSLLAVSSTVMAATMDITESFSPSMDKPENNVFTNTTPQGTMCSKWPSLCPAGVFTISLPVTLQPNADAIHVADTDVRDHMYFKGPVQKYITLTNTETGAVSQAVFSVTKYSGAAWDFKNPGDINEWADSNYGISMPQGGCSRGGQPVASNRWYYFLWAVNNSANPAGCYKRKINNDMSLSGVSIRDLSIGYSLVTPNPLTMEAGTYTSSLTYSLGVGGDLDFGNKWSPTDSELTINFTLSVNHELKLTTTAENQAVSLQPCASDRVCTTDEGSANWERWMVTRITPQLTGRSNFSLSSSGAFTVYLECEQQSGSDCALRSDKMPSQTVPVQTLMTLPDNIVDNVTGSTVSKRRLEAGRDLTKNVFVTKMFGQSRAGSIDFLVGQKDVDTMLTTRPDTFRGAVTVIFDPKIY